MNVIVTSHLGPEAEAAAGRLVQLASRWARATVATEWADADHTVFRLYFEPDEQALRLPFGHIADALREASGPGLRQVVVVGSVRPEPAAADSEHVTEQSVEPVGAREAGPAASRDEQPGATQMSLGPVAAAPPPPARDEAPGATQLLEPVAAARDELPGSTMLLERSPLPVPATTDPILAPSAPHTTEPVLEPAPPSTTEPVLEPPPRAAPRPAPAPAPAWDANAAIGAPDSPGTMVQIRRVVAETSAAGTGMCVVVLSATDAEVVGLEPSTGKKLVIRTDARWDVVEGETLVFQPARVWRFARAAIAEGRYVEARPDPALAGLPPLGMRDHGGAFEFERPGIRNEDGKVEDPLPFARQAISAGMLPHGRTLVRTVLREDPRSLEAHDLLAAAALREGREDLAARHDAVLLVIAGAALGAGFPAKLSRTLRGNVPVWNAVERWAGREPPAALEPLLREWRHILEL